MDILANPSPKDWLVEGLVLRGRINMWAGAEKSGKSRIVSQAILCALAQRDFCGRDTNDPGRILMEEHTIKELTKKADLKDSLIEGGD